MLNGERELVIAEWIAPASTTVSLK
jgi:hypothetical protein